MRHREPTRTHICYAQKRKPGIADEHQATYCLTDEHGTCPFYLEPPPLPRPVAIEQPEDDIGPAPGRVPPLRIVLWVIVAIAVIIAAFFYGSALMTPLSSGQPAAGPKATPRPTPMVGQATMPAAAAIGSPRPTFAFVKPTATPTPYPGGAIYSIFPEASTAGWVASNEPEGNHLGDFYMYAGVFDGVIYHGAWQFDLAAVPRGATIHAATLELTGLDDRRLGTTGVWEIRILPESADAEWNRHTFQTIHSAPAEWSVPPPLGAGDLQVGKANALQIPQDVLRDWERRLIDMHYTVSFRLDGPLTGDNSVFAWATGYGSDKEFYRPRLLLNVGPAPLTPYPTGSPPPTGTPEWIVVTSTPTPGNIVTAAAIALRQTAWATTTGTPTSTPAYVITATPLYIVVTLTPTPGNAATAAYQRAVATARVILTGTPTPAPPNLATATRTPRPTNTPALIWLDELAGTPTATLTPTPTTGPIPAVLKGKILFLSDRTGKEEVYALEPESGRVALVTDRWPYGVALQGENRSPDGQSWAYVGADGRHIAQIFIHSEYYGSSWQLTYNTGRSYDPVWMPGGDKVAFVSTENGNDDIFVIRADGTGQQRLTVNNWEWDKHPSWSPDGRQIVFWSNAETGRSQLWIMNADGTGRRLLLNSPYNDWDPVWAK